jgi:hypothetical protein
VRPNLALAASSAIGYLPPFAAGEAMSATRSYSLVNRSIAIEVDPVVAGRQPLETGGCMDDLARSILL